MRARRLVSIPVGVLLGLLLVPLVGPGTLLADTAVSHTGIRGVHHLADSAEFPGALCTYDDTVIASVRVRDPFVYARNASTTVDRQWVSWNFLVQARTAGSGSWARVATSALQRAVASDTQVADFRPMAVHLAGSAGKEYRVLVVVRWFGPGGTTEVGRSVHRVDRYAWEGVPSFEGLCPGGIF